MKVQVVRRGGLMSSEAVSPPILSAAAVAIIMIIVDHAAWRRSVDLSTYRSPRFNRRGQRRRPQRPANQTSLSAVMPGRGELTQPSPGVCTATTHHVSLIDSGFIRNSVWGLGEGLRIWYETKKEFDMCHNLTYNQLNIPHKSITLK